MVKKYKIVLIQHNNVKKVLATSNVKRNIYSKFNKFLKEKYSIRLKFKPHVSLCVILKTVDIEFSAHTRNVMNASDD